MSKTSSKFTNMRLLKRDPEIYLTIADAADVLRVSRAVIYRLAKDAMPFETKYGVLCIKKAELYNAVGLTGDDDWLLTPQEVGRTLEVTPQVVNRWCSKYGIGEKVSKRWRIPFSRLKTFMWDKWGVDLEAEPAALP